jgi:hypothetical protein
METKFEELEKSIDNRIELIKSELDIKRFDVVSKSFEIIANKISKNKLQVKSNKKI